MPSHARGEAGSARPPDGGGSTVRDVAVLSLGHAAVMALGGVLALLIAHDFGRSARTDAFFAAYGVYSIALVFSQAFRLTALPRLIDDPDELRSNTAIAGVVVAILVAALPMVLLAEPFGELIVDRDPGDVAPESLRALWPALAGQLLIGLLAALLLVRGLFTVIGLAYVASGLTSIAGYLALKGALGIQAVSVALGISALGLSALFFVALTRAGWRFRPAVYTRVPSAAAEAGRLFLASSSFVAANFGYLICVAVASREGTGEATLYAYAYFSAALLVATTAVSAAMVRAPQLLARSSERPSEQPASVASTLSTYRFTAVLLMPVFGIALLVGEPVLGWLLGSDFDGRDARQMVAVLMLLSGWVLASAAGVYAIVELLAAGRARMLAAIAAGQTALLLALAVVGRELAGLEGIAIAQSLSMMLGTVVQLRLAFGSGWLGCVAELGRTTLRAAAVAAAAFAPGLLVAQVGDESLGAMLGAVALSLGLAVVATRLCWPQEWRALLDSLPRRLSTLPGIGIREAREGRQAP